MRKLLIATTNKGKFKEMASELADLPFKIISLSDLKKKIPEPIENKDSIEENSILKAKYYALKTGLLSLADDGGLFINSLSGWPGVISARIANTDLARRKLVLSRLKEQTNRSGFFASILTLYDPDNKTIYSASGHVDGLIKKKEVGQNGFGYDPIFYVPTKKKTYAQMTSLEKNLISHRGIALNKIKYYLTKQYGLKQLVVPVAIIVKDKKMLMTKRRDFREDYNNKWELPGGLMDEGNDMNSNLIREVKEETGYNIKILERLPEFFSETKLKYDYQVFLIPHICQIKSGKFKLAKNECNGYGWFTLSQAIKEELLPLNIKILTNKNNLKILKKYINY